MGLGLVFNSVLLSSSFEVPSHKFLPFQKKESFTLALRFAGSCGSDDDSEDKDSEDSSPCIP